MKRIDPNDPATWPKDYRQCSLCNFGARGIKRKEMEKHVKEKHGK